MSNNNLSITNITSTDSSTLPKIDTSVVSSADMNHTEQVELFNSLVHGSNVTIIIPQIQTDPVNQLSVIQGDHYLTSLMNKMDKWRNSGNSYLNQIYNSLKDNSLNAPSMMKMQLDLLKFSLGYEMASKMVGKGIGAIDTLLRSQ